MGKRKSPLARDPFVAPLDPPDDMVEGTDPEFSLTVSEVTAVQVTCTCGSLVVGLREDAERLMTEHLMWAHRASRNPVLTCHAAPLWDHERWCMRPKDHEGPHWTPNGSHQGVWWPNG